MSKSCGGSVGAKLFVVNWLPTEGKLRRSDLFEKIKTASEGASPRTLRLNNVIKMPKMTLTIVPGHFAVCRFDPQEAAPDWVFEGDFFSVTRTVEELSVVCREDIVPEGLRSEAGWACLKVEGPLDLSLTGVMASLAVPLAEAGISIFAVSTYDTDYLLVKVGDLERAVAVLTQERFEVRG